MNNSKLSFTILLPFFVASCGGGGGGGNNHALNSIDNNRVKPVIIQTYDPVPGPIDASVENGTFVRDLNASGTQEVVVSGRSSQPFDMDTDDVNDWQKYEIQVFGWNTGDFENETSSWFSDGDNRILGNNPSVYFGDFDGDSQVDMGVSHDTDMELYGPSQVYFNTGSSSFEKVLINHDDTWSHDAAVADFNGDGFDDFLIGSFSGNMSLAFGAADRTFDLYQATSSPVGIGIAVGDFLGDGTVSIVTTGGSNNQELYSWATDGDELQLTRESNLPDSRFELPKWDDERAVQEDEYHTIRAITFDFDGNGIDDVVTISTLDKDDNVHGFTEVQFLKNDGTGTFADVTDDILKEFDTNQNATYTPKLVDVNNDGLTDIVLSTKSFSDDPSTSILFQQSDGTFVEDHVEEFQAYNNTLEGLIEDNFSATPEHTVVLGPDDKYYLVSVGMTNEDDGDMLNKVFLSEIGNNGTITTASTVSALMSQWPWMTDAQANEILSFTASDYVDGMPVIDYREAMSPIGGLSLVVSGGDTFNQIQGHISGVELDEQISALALDNIDRTFTIDLGSSVYSERYEWNSVINIQNQNQTSFMTQSSNLVGGQEFSSHGVVIQQSDDMKNNRVSLPSIEFSENMFLTISFAKLNFNPWLSMSGVWGEVNKTNIMESVFSIKKDNWIANGGIMHTETDINPGLVTSVNDIYAFWGDVGWQHKNDNFGFFTGIDPSIIEGSVTVSLPDSVDNKGNLIYSESKIPLINTESFYIRAFYRKNIFDNLNVKSSGILRNRGNYNVSIDTEWNF